MPPWTVACAPRRVTARYKGLIEILSRPSRRKCVSTSKSLSHDGDRRHQTHVRLPEESTKGFEVLLLETLVNLVLGENLDDLLREPHAQRLEVSNSVSGVPLRTSTCTTQVSMFCSATMKNQFREKTLKTSSTPPPPAPPPCSQRWRVRPGHRTPRRPASGQLTRRIVLYRLESAGAGSPSRRRRRRTVTFARQPEGHTS